MCLIFTVFVSHRVRVSQSERYYTTDLHHGFLPLQLLLFGGRGSKTREKKKNVIM